MQLTMNRADLAQEIAAQSWRAHPAYAATSVGR